MTAFIECEHAAKWYGQIIAVNDVSLSVPGGVTGLLGPNGAGKSTLLKMMVGQLRPSKGVVKVLGESVWGNLALLRRIGYCPEHEGTYEDLTGLEMVTALTELHGFTHADAKARAEKMFGVVDLKDAMHRRLGEYSKGMRQRAKLAQAMAHDPEVVFLDEPLTGCDPLARVRILAVIADLAREGRCVVVSSHVLHEIETMTSQILLIHKGQLRAEGDVHQIRALIDAHPHKVRVDCDKPRALAEKLVAQEHVVAVSVDGEGIVVDTRTPDRSVPRDPRGGQSLGRVHPRADVARRQHGRGLQVPDGDIVMIGMAEGSRIYARMAWLRMRRGRMVWVAAAMFVLPLAYVVGLAIAGHWGRGLFDDVCELYFRFLIPFVPALTASAAVAEEIENKTFTFVFARPAPRGALVIGKLWAATVPAILVVVPSLAIAWVVAQLRFPADMADTWPHLLRVELAAVAGLCAYAALAAAIGTLFSRHPLVAVLVYLMLVEEGLGSAPIVLNLITVGWHLRNVAELPLPETAFMALTVPWWASAIAALAVTPGLILLTNAGVSGAEYRTDR